MSLWLPKVTKSMRGRMRMKNDSGTAPTEKPMESAASDVKKTMTDDEWEAWKRAIRE